MHVDIEVMPATTTRAICIAQTALDIEVAILALVITAIAAPKCC